MKDIMCGSNEPATGDHIVCSDGEPMTVRTAHHTEKTLDDVDTKIRLLGYSTTPLTPIEEEPPPKYDSLSDGRSSSPLNLAHVIRHFLLDSFCLKLLLLYIFTTHITGHNNSLSSFLSLDWLSAGHWTRSHSRDFQYAGTYELTEGDEIWTRSRLGRLGPYSSYLTRSEIELISEVEWEPEPDLRTENDEVITKELVDEALQGPRESDMKLPLAFHQPSSLLSYSRQLLGEGQRRSILKLDPTAEES